MSSDERETRGLSGVIRRVSEKKIEAGLFMTRILTCVFSLSFFLPIFGGSPSSWFRRALLSNAATSAVRLHQRLPNVRLSAEFLNMLMKEDSAHYLGYSIIFLNSSEPFTLVLIPIFLFALLHFFSYALFLLDAFGASEAFWLKRILVNFVKNYSSQILRTVALVEILVFPFTILFIFMGRVSLFTPFLYFWFIRRRYASNRNPYTKTLFRELRLSLEHAASSPSFPQVMRTLVYKAITKVSEMAPVAN